jgi:choline-glycine betaine transporter
MHKKCVSQQNSAAAKTACDKIVQPKQHSKNRNYTEFWWAWEVSWLLFSFLVRVYVVQQRTILLRAIVAALFCHGLREN